MSILRLAERNRLAAVIEMSLKLVGEHDPELLLQAVSHLAREIIPTQYASVSILDEDGQTMSGPVFLNGLDAAAVSPATRVLRPGPLANMLVARRALRLRDVTSESLGLDFLPADYQLSSVLGVPLCGSLRVRGLLLLANKLDADEFDDQDEEVAIALASQVTLALERMEGQRRRDGEMAESGEVLEAMFESAPDAIAVVDERGRISKVNAQIQNLFGYTRNEMLGQLIEILVPERFRTSHAARRQPGSGHHGRPMGEAVELELFGRRKDASEFSADIMLGPLETKRGKLMLTVVRDATARKQNEKRIQQLNRSLERHVAELQTANQDLEAFSYTVSHDLRAPLRHVNSFSLILRERMGPQADAATSHYLQRIQDAATHMGCLLEGLLHLANLERHSLQLRPTNLHSLASQVIEELKLDAQHRQIEWILDPLPIVQCDRVLVKAVFSNLLSNAVKFTSLRECAIIRVGHRSKNGETIFFVADNGVGFDMKYADKLFGIFQRLHHSEDFPGTGIGLATVHRIIRKHGGRIWAEAELNSCATFHFTLLPRGVEQAERIEARKRGIHE